VIFSVHVVKNRDCLEQSGTVVTLDMACREPASDVADNLGVGLRNSVYGVYRPGNDFKLISMVNMETRNAVESYFGTEFPAIYRPNHFGVMVA